jgi:mannose/fructose/N-acetylgalactosamine-specific phosphotransferase system component IIC
MLTEIVIALAAFFTAYYFVNVLQFTMAIKRVWKLPPEKRLKPFDCVQCLSVWLAIALYFLPIQISSVLLVSFGAGFISTKVK